MPRRDRIIVQAFLGPPVTGVATAKELVIGVLRKIGFEVHVINLDGPGTSRVARRVLAEMRALIAMVRERSSPVYRTMSGGVGALADSLFALLNRQRRVVWHHHTRSYLERQSFWHLVAMTLSTDAMHLVLDLDSQERLVRLYGVDCDRVHVVSNAAWLAVADTPPPQGRRHGIIALGNFAFGKADEDLLALARAAEADHWSLAVAGPTSTQLAKLLNRHGADLLGPVAHDEVHGLLAGYEFHFFASRYREGVPMVILEASLAGTPTLLLAGRTVDHLTSFPGVTVLASVQDAGRLVRDSLESWSEQKRSRLAVQMRRLVEVERDKATAALRTAFR